MTVCTWDGTDDSCRFCSGELCNLCGAGWWGGSNRDCQHDVHERHQEASE